MSSILPSLPTEIAYLALCAPLLLAYIGAQTVLAGGDGVKSAGEAPRGGASGIGFRAEKALRNFGETFPLFAAMALAVTVAGKADWWTGLGAALYFWGRVAYLIAYLAGIGPVRSAIWTASAAGIAIMFWQLAF